MPVSLFHGDNTLEIDEHVRTVRDTYAGTDALTLDGTSVSIADLTEAALTVGLFDPERLVIVRNLQDRLKGRKESSEMAEIAQLLGSIPPTTHLVLICPGMGGDHPLLGTVRAVGGKVQSYTTPKARDLPRWIRERAGAHRVAFDPDAAEMLGELIGANLQLLDQEIEKLATYAGSEGRVTPAMVESMVGVATQSSIFTLVDAIAGGNTARALHLLHEQLDGSSSSPTEVALYLIRMLARQVRILLRIRLGQESGRPTAQIMSDLKVPRYYTERYLRQAGRLSSPRLRHAFEALAALEHGIKSGQTEIEAGLDLLVTDLSQ